MKKKSHIGIFSKLLYFINSIFATLLFLSYFLPYFSPKKAPIFSVFSLIVPLLGIINVIFLIYWILKLKKHFLISGLVLLAGLFLSTPFYKIIPKKNFFTNDLKVMSYNVRMFNIYKQIKTDSIEQKIINFINKKKPDILAIQEFYKPYQKRLKFPYHYISESKKEKFGLAIFSNYKIIKSGFLEFQESANKTIFVDILKNNDTIRVYNIHLQSLKINPKKENFGEKSSEKLIDRLKKGFIKQTEQTQKIIKHEQNFQGKKILCGDFNNTAYSWVYKKIATHKKDAFVEAGKGFGKSFNYTLPMRIDFILTDKNATINYFQTFSKEYSDHYPIMARCNWK